jgi:uncharacterized protein (DUF58 family)
VRFLDHELLSRLARLPFRAQRVVEGARGGHHRSPLHGSSVEFAEHKVYSPGDELRHLDWKAYGKLDKFYVRRFEHETELRTHFLVDASGSMGYRGDGPHTKLEYASYVCASLAYVLLHQQDAVGLLAAGGGERTWIPSRASSRHVFELGAALERLTPDGPTDLGAALEFLGERTPRRGITIVLSDLFDDPARVVAGLRHLVARRHQVIVLHVLDAHELEFPFEGLTLFESMESDSRVLCDARAARSAFLREMQAFIERYRRECLEGGISYRLLSTARPLADTLIEVLGA